MHSALVILAAVVAGWAVQLYLSYQQSMAFNRQVLRLRSSGTVSVGAGGKRYRGGRAFVAIAVDDHGIVRDALGLSGFTTFARARPVPALFDLKLNAVRGERDIPQLSRQQREAARQAALLFTQGQGALAGV
jgi:DNA-binding transcriptional regulator of glucitol operon